MTSESVNLPIGSITTRDRALSEAAQIFAHARAQRDALPAREAALAAFVPGGPTIDELVVLIQAQRERARAKAARRSTAA